MKAITVEVPRDGASIQLVLGGGASSAQVVIVADDDVEIRYGNAGVGTPGAAPPARNNAQLTQTPPLELDAISASLLKLRTKTRSAAVDVIRTMFQFTNPITAETANKILEDLRKRGDLTITAGGELEFADQKESGSRD